MNLLRPGSPNCRAPFLKTNPTTPILPLFSSNLILVLSTSANIFFSPRPRHPIECPPRPISILDEKDPAPTILPSDNHATTQGHMGIFLMVVEFLDAIPEAAVIAIYVIEHTVDVSLVASICTLNFATGLATFCDLLKNDSAHQSHVLFVTTTFASGMLVYSVSNDIYGHFEDEYDHGVRNSFQFGMLLLGTMSGAILVLVLMWIHNSKAALTLREKLKRLLPCWSTRMVTLAKKKSEQKSVLFSLVLVSLLVAWTISLCILFVLLFNSLYVQWGPNEQISGVCFIEGISGGAFIVTIGGTIIPYSQQGAKGITNWGKTRKTIVGSLVFLTGLLSGELLSTLL